MTGSVKGETWCGVASRDGVGGDGGSAGHPSAVAQGGLSRKARSGAPPFTSLLSVGNPHYNLSAVDVGHPPELIIVLNLADVIERAPREGILGAHVTSCYDIGHGN